MLRFGASVNYRSKAYGDFKPDPRLAIENYMLVDLRAGIESNDQRWRVGAFGRNITNKYYWTTVVRRGDAVVRYAGMPATYGIELSLRY